MPDDATGLIAASSQSRLWAADGAWHNARAMKMIRRHFLQSVTAAVAMPAIARRAFAQAYPVRPVHLIVSVPPGGSPDIIGRLLGQYLSGRLGQPFVIENRPGASANIATEYVMNAPPDGYTLLLAMSANAINASLFHHLNYNFMRDSTPVAGVGAVPLVMIENPSFPAKTVPDFIAYAKGNPGKINMALAGKGTPLDVAGELFKMMAGVDIIGVPYQGEAPAVPDLMSGQVQIMFGAMPTSLGYIKSGKLRAVAVTSATRQEILPDVPVMAEFLPSYEASGWYGVAAPKATPPEVVATLNKAINAALADAEVKKRFAELGCAPSGGSPADFGKFVAEETDKWAKVIKFAGITAD
jgi:tripartite-type tricarboxylate transporter receptor subunit TctC